MYKIDRREGGDGPKIVLKYGPRARNCIITFVKISLNLGFGEN